MYSAPLGKSFFIIATEFPDGRGFVIKLIDWEAEIWRNSVVLRSDDVTPSLKLRKNGSLYTCYYCLQHCDSHGYQTTGYIRSWLKSFEWKECVTLIMPFVKDQILKPLWSVAASADSIFDCPFMRYAMSNLQDKGVILLVSIIILPDVRPYNLPQEVWNIVWYHIEANQENGDVSVIIARCVFGWRGTRR